MKKLILITILICSTKAFANTDLRVCSLSVKSGSKIIFSKAESVSSKAGFTWSALNETTSDGGKLIYAGASQKPGNAFVYASIEFKGLKGLETISLQVANNGSDSKSAVREDGTPITAHLLCTDYKVLLAQCKTELGWINVFVPEQRGATDNAISGRSGFLRATYSGSQTILATVKLKLRIGFQGGDALLVDYSNEAATGQILMRLDNENCVFAEREALIDAVKPGVWEHTEK